MSERSTEPDQDSLVAAASLAMLSHDLRAPLNAVLGFAELLRDELVGPLNPTQKEYLGEIIHGGETLLAMIDGRLNHPQDNNDEAEPF
ncbi:signal transduction histidine kinase [Actimicrobium sp. GrIS 1.19]|uniref:histidine kinase dimerization/phospho-acceptor domain-containing protein n=1 Tax=Actimicrobium sp. GrIS 1.19 TaxID=3071708 RepID=UPI002DFEF055|nr:signal transduction histidine kinase [Actimicrobium sp. GrIS 1.19]